MERKKLEEALEAAISLARWEALRLLDILDETELVVIVAPSRAPLHQNVGVLGAGLARTAMQIATGYADYSARVLAHQLRAEGHHVMYRNERGEIEEP